MEDVPKGKWLVKLRDVIFFLFLYCQIGDAVPIRTSRQDIWGTEFTARTINMEIPENEKWERTWSWLLLRFWARGGQSCSTDIKKESFYAERCCLCSAVLSVSVPVNPCNLFGPLHSLTLDLLLVSYCFKLFLCVHTNVYVCVCLRVRVQSCVFETETVPKFLGVFLKNIATCSS